MKKYNYIVSTVIWFISVLFFQSYAQQSEINRGLIANYFKSIEEVSKPFINDAKLNLEKHNYTLIQQVGFNNAIEVKGSVSDSQTISQKGNNNQYNFINYYNKTVSEFNINQQGNSNSLQVYGKNSIVKKLGILQNSNFKTIIIKNY